MNLPGQRTDLVCPECGSAMALRQSKHGLFYGCTSWPACTATHGASANGTPSGTPANAETRRLRIEAHKALDKLWMGRGKMMSRPEAYVKLQQIMGMTADEAHIGCFNADQCRTLIE